MPVPAGTGEQPRVFLRDLVYERVRDAIVSGQLEPGEVLREPELREWLGVSGTPIRQALAKLEEAGLVETVANRYTRVTQLDLREVLETYQVVAALHELAARLAAGRLSKGDVDAMRVANRAFAAAVESEDLDAATAADDALHGVILQAALNGLVMSTLERLTPIIRRAERVRFRVFCGRKSVHQHAQLIAKCLAGDVDGAAQVARLNWEPVIAHIHEVLASH